MVVGNRVRERSLTPDTYETFLTAASIVLFVTVLVALAKGHARWATVPWPVWVHLATILPALALTPLMLLRPRGDSLHRALGKIWVVAMWLTAAFSFVVRISHPGRLSLIHLISAYVVIAAPLIWWTAHNHRIAQHRRQVRGMVTGALLIAGFFTLPFGRLLGTWLFA